MLLRVTFDDGVIGYGDCHPWPEIGDPPIEKLLQERMSAPLFAHAVAFARIDGKARASKRSLFAGLQVPDSHYLLPRPDPNLIEERSRQGFSRFKVKVPTLSDLIVLCQAAVTSEVQLRVDCNEQLTEGEYDNWAKRLLPWTGAIDFFEDPYPYDPTAWNRSRQRWPFHFACDRKVTTALSGGSVDCFVMKPAVVAIPLDKLAGKRVVVTSYLGHPIGQAAAAYAAAQARSAGVDVDICGLLSHHCGNNSFTNQTDGRGAAFVAAKGTGCGFDAQLEAIRWKKVT